MIYLFGVRNLYTYTSVKTWLILLLAFHSNVSYYCGSPLATQPISNPEGPAYLSGGAASGMGNTCSGVLLAPIAILVMKYLFLYINSSHSHFSSQLFLQRVIKETFYFLLLCKCYLSRRMK